MLSWASWIFKALMSSSMGGSGRGMAGQGADLGFCREGKGLRKVPVTLTSPPCFLSSWCSYTVGGRRGIETLGCLCTAERGAASRPLPTACPHTHTVVTADAPRRCSVFHHGAKLLRFRGCFICSCEAGGRSWPPAPRGPCVGGAGARREAEMCDLQLQVKSLASHLD